MGGSVVYVPQPESRPFFDVETRRLRQEVDIFLFPGFPSELLIDLFGVRNLLFTFIILALFVSGTLDEGLTCFLEVAFEARWISEWTVHVS